MNITLTCFCCGCSFQRKIGEVRRNERAGRCRTFCSRKCSTVTHNKMYRRAVVIHHCGPARDEYSPFRWYLKVVNQRKNKTNDLSLAYLKSLWDRQRGVCPYTGIKMGLPETTGSTLGQLKSASLDRIDSSKGYLRGNVEFVCAFINFAKSNRPKREVEEFLMEVKRISHPTSFSILEAIKFGVQNNFQLING